MATSQQPSSMIRFGSFELDAVAAELRKNGMLIKLQPQPLKVLFLLIQHAGQVVTREEIQQCLWSDSTFVDFERGINFSINQIRGALADNADKPRYIETLPRRGYRFIAELKQEGSAKEVPSAHAPVAANYPAAAGGNGANASPVPVSFVPALTRVVVTTGWSRWRLILAGVTAAIGFLAFAGFTAYRAVFRSPRISFEKLQISKLTDSGGAVDVAMSPDGRYVVYAMRAAEGSSLRLREVDTRGDVEILPPENVYFHGLTFSPDGKYIYFVDTPKDSEGLNSLFTMPVLGGPPHLLGKYADTPVSFSPNGKEFTYTQGLADRNILEVRTANADGTGDRLLASIIDGTADFQPGPAWSPNGQIIAVPVMLEGKKVRWVLAAVSVTDGSVRELYSYPHEIGRAVWLPEGDAILMTMRDKTGRGQLWAISYPRGKAVRLTNDIENYQHNIDVTRDGKNVVAIATTLASNVWMVPGADASRGRQITSNAAPLTQVTALPPGKVLAGSADGEMWLMKTDGSERTPFTTARNAYSPARCGGSVVFNSFHDDTIHLMHVDADGLNPTRLLQGDVGPPTCSTDGRFIFFPSKIKPYVILRVSSGGGDPMEIAKSPGYEILGRVAVSPDGKFLAYAYDEALPAIGAKLAVIPISGGAPLHTLKVPSDVADLRWSPDGQRLQYLLTRSEATNLWEQSLLGGEPQQFTKFTSGRIFDFDWSPDGKQLLLVRGETTSDAVLLSHLR